MYIVCYETEPVGPMRTIRARPKVYADWQEAEQVAQHLAKNWKMPAWLVECPLPAPRLELAASDAADLK